jgi:hypothetical protein
MHATVRYIPRSAVPGRCLKVPSKVSLTDARVRALETPSSGQITILLSMGCTERAILTGASIQFDDNFPAAIVA